MLMSSLRQKLSRFFNRPVTFLAVPSGGNRTFRWQCTTAFLLFAVSLWTGFSLWACFIVGRHVDYWITKGDNEVLRTKLAIISREMDKSEVALNMAETTDHEMRTLLNLSPRASRDDYSGVGGPTAEDSARLRQIMLEGPEAINLPEWRHKISKVREESYKRLASFQEIGWYMSNQRSLYRATPDIWPTEGRITSLFGYRFNPMRLGDGENQAEFHPGIDIANRPDTLIYATADGTVRAAGWFHGYGQMILIDHGYGVSTVYGHTSKILVSVGQHVRRGQLIAYMGTTGRSTGAHLHYEVRIHNHPVNPQRFLKIHAGLKEEQGDNSDVR